MKIEFDPRKNQRNIEQRGFSYELVYFFNFETAIYKEDRRKNYGKTRMIALGYINERLYSLVYTLRRDVLRVISHRKANNREAVIYAQSNRSRIDR